MPRNLLNLSLILLCHLSLSVIAEISPQTEAALDNQLFKNSQRYGVVGQSVLILKNHQPVYRGMQGFANFELDVKIDKTHLFPSYSVTKLLTSVLMMQLVESGQVKLNTSIRTYLPYLPARWQTVTVEHLLTHTSGIPRYFDIAMKNNQFLPTKKQVFLSLVEQPDHFEMGTTYSYNNTNFLLLSAILENKSGQSYQQLVNEKIIRTLGLKNTGHASAKKIIKNMVTSYSGANGSIKRNIDIDWPAYTFAHSALYSTPEDLTTFMTALIKGHFVSTKTLNKLWQPMKLNNGEAGHYAFGFEFVAEDNYFHVGHDGGNKVKLRHYFSKDNPTDNYTLAYLTNGNAYSVWTDVLAESLMSIIEPTKFKIPALKEQYMSAIFDKDTNRLNHIYQKVSLLFDSNLAKIEEFFLIRAYALQYGSGANSSIPAFELLTAMFPASANARESLADAWAAAGNKTKAIRNYRLVLKLNPSSNYAKKQIKSLESLLSI
jgi:CubicO group peptidase (beta-lactamase class C family)